jgi:hypothetical protein
LGDVVLAAEVGEAGGAEEVSVRWREHHRELRLGECGEELGFEVELDPSSHQRCRVSETLKPARSNRSENKLKYNSNTTRKG